MFKEIGVGEEGEKRIIVLSNSLAWAGGPDAASKSESAGLPRMEDLLSSGSLEEEEKFDGNLAHETAFLCYSSVSAARLDFWGSIPTNSGIHAGNHREAQGNYTTVAFIYLNANDHQPNPSRV